jgi:hypothetical protein
VPDTATGVNDPIGDFDLIAIVFGQGDSYHYAGAPKNQVYKDWCRPYLCENILDSYESPPYVPNSVPSECSKALLWFQFGF